MKITRLCAAVLCTLALAPPEVSAEGLDRTCAELGGGVSSISRLDISIDSRLADDTQVELTLVLEPPARLERGEVIHFAGGGPVVSRITTLDGSIASVRPGAVGVPLHVDKLQDPDAFAQQLRSELSRHTLAFLCGAGLEVKVTDAGRAEAPDGTAHVLAVAAPQFSGSLFLDSKSWVPLMLRYEGIPKRSGTRKSATRGQDGTSQPSAPTETVDMRLGEWKPVDGLLMPHRITFSAGEALTEEWTVRRFKLTKRSN